MNIRLPPYLTKLKSGNNLYASQINPLNKENKIMKRLTIEDLQNYSTIRSNLIIRLVNKANIPTDRVVLPIIDDIYATFGILMEENYDSNAIVVITDKMLADYGKTAMEIYNDALANLEKKYELKSMTEVLKEMCPDMSWLVGEDNNGMYVLTVKNKQNGAACVLNRNIMDAVSRKINSKNIFIIPSSIHEVLIVDRDYFGDMTAEDVTDMIGSVNETEVAPNEVLSEHAYTYNYDYHCISRA